MALWCTLQYLIKGLLKMDRVIYIYIYISLDGAANKINIHL